MDLSDACARRGAPDSAVAHRPVPDAPIRPPALTATSASRFLLITDPAVEWARRLAMIGRARHFVHLLTYYVGHDAWACELLDALVTAQRRGVEVMLGIDAFGQFLGTQKLSAAERADLDARLAALGPAVRYYRAPSRLQRTLGAGQHVKIQLSDAGEALHGSSNLSHRSFEPTQWKEVAFSLWGPAAQVALETIGALFPGAVTDRQRATLAAAVRLDELTDGVTDGLKDGATDAPGCPLEYAWHDPNPGASRWAPVAGVRNPLTQRLVEAIDGARRTVHVTSFYFKPCRTLADAFERAARRGVAVEVFHSHRDALVESAMPWMAAAADYRRWHAAGLTIHESRRGEHAKLLLVDDAELAVGSYNFEHAAHDRLAELMVFVRDPRVLGQARAHFATLRADPDNRRADAAAYAREPLALRVRTRLFSPLRRWF